MISVAPVHTMHAVVDAYLEASSPTSTLRVGWYGFGDPSTSIHMIHICQAESRPAKATFDDTTGHWTCSVCGEICQVKS